VATDSDRLLVTLAEQLKVPWLQVAHATELTRQNLLEAAAVEDETRTDLTTVQQLFGTIDVVSQAALQLIDGYLLSTQLNFGAAGLELEPVSVSSTMYDVAQRLDGYAKVYDCELELAVQGRFGPIMANRRALDAALSNLGYSFIEAAQNTTVRLVLRRNKHGISTGIFSTVDGLSNDLLKRARKLYGYARQPLSGFTASSGAGVFVADSLMNSMDGRLRTSRQGALTGLAATFVPSRQLSLV